MAAAERDADLTCCAAERVEDGSNQRFVRLVLGQQQRGQEPAGNGAHCGDVVGVDVDRVVADFVRREGYRVRLDHQAGLAEVDDGGVLAHLRTHQNAFVLCRAIAQQAGEHFEREFARRQE